MYTGRPKLQIPKTKIEWLFDSIGIGFYLVAVVYLLFSWGSLPEQVPGHYNAAGEVDRWGSKYEILVLPLVGGFLGMTTFFIEKKPHIHNYPARLNETNASAFYLNSRKLANAVKNGMLVVFALLTIQTVRIALGNATSIGGWFFPFTLVITLGPIIPTLILQSKIK